jgi:hypothetical protein
MLRRVYKAASEWVGCVHDCFSTGSNAVLIDGADENPQITCHALIKYSIVCKHKCYTIVGMFNVLRVGHMN